MKRTVLFEKHQALGARLIDFGGWEMPVQYRGIVAEHRAVRSAVGLFDISHMGEVLVTGPGAAAFLNRVLTNDVKKLRAGEAQYSLMCQEDGGVVDDLYVYALDEGTYLLIVNASRVETDVSWLEKQHREYPEREQVQLRNESERYAALAVQGPKAAAVVDAVLAGKLEQGNPSAVLEKNRCRFWGGGTVEQIRLVARTGYTGEDGFELVLPVEEAVALWESVLREGAGCQLEPAGLGARDTLRLEAGYPLYGQELDLETTPMEAALSIFVNFDKGDFVGRKRLWEQKEAGVTKRLVGLRMTEKSAPPRAHYPIYSGDGRECLGEVTSGTQSPTLGVGIGMGYVRKERAKIGEQVQIEIRGRRAGAEVVKRTFYRAP